MQIRFHDTILFSVFILLLLFKGLLDTVPLLYGEGLRWYGEDPGATYVTLGSLALLFFGAYLVWVSCISFNKIYSDWKNNAFAYKKLFATYGKVFLYSLYLFLIAIGPTIASDPGLIPRILELDTLIYYFLVDFSIFFPISLFTLFLSIRSLIFAKNHARSYRFGISTLLISNILLIVSIPSLLLLGSFWLHGGGQFYI